MQPISSITAALTMQIDVEAQDLLTPTEKEENRTYHDVLMRYLKGEVELPVMKQMNIARGNLVRQQASRSAVLMARIAIARMQCDDAMAGSIQDPVRLASG